MSAVSGVTERPAGQARRRRFSVTDRKLRSLQIYLWRVGILIVVLLAWQLLPENRALQQLSPVFNPFFISSPVRVAHVLGGLITGRGEPLVWPYLLVTLEATALGFMIGVCGGALMGLLLSHDRRVREVLSPYINAVNAMPKIAIIPVIIIVFGSTMHSSIAVSAILVFFAVFFNAYAGGRGVPVEMLQNVHLMGASGADVMVRVRSMYVALWTFEALPNAVSHGLLGVVTAEFLSGVRGIGSLIVQSLVQVDATLTFAAVVILSVVGVILVSATELLKRRILHWWPGAQ